MMKRPSKGDKLTIHPRKTKYRKVPGSPAPLGYIVGEDGHLWLEAEEGTVTRVRKKGDGFTVYADIPNFCGIVMHSDSDERATLVRKC